MRVLVAIAAVVLLLPAFTLLTVEKTEGFANPESIASDGKDFFVSNIGLQPEPTEKDGDGFISKLGADGKVTELKFITGLHAPKGMAVIGKILYVADVDRVKGYDLNSRKQVFTADLEKENLVFLNDLVQGEHNKLLVSATDIGRVFEIDVTNGKYTELKFSASITGPNGLQYDSKSKTIYIASLEEKGKVYKAEKSDREYKVNLVYEEPGNYDGLYLSGNTLLVSDWTSGTIKKIDLRTGKAEELKFPDIVDFSGPADFLYDGSTKTIWIPEMQTGVLWRIPLSL